MRKRLHGVLGLAVVVGALSGCGGGDPEPERPVAARPSAEVREALRDPESNVSVVRTFWRFMQAGALPSALEQYDARVVRETGAGNFAGMLAAQQPALNDIRINPLTVEPAPDGVLVTAESVPRVGAKQKYSFYMRRRGDRWRIVYDTLSASALQSFVQQTVQRSIAPNSETPSGRALKAGDDAVATFRSVALDLDAAARRSGRNDRPADEREASPSP